MRIGHVTFGYRPTLGGAETYLVELIRVLAEAGHTQRVYQRSTGDAGPDILRVPTCRRLSPGMQFWSLAATLPLRWPWLAREDLLIVHYPLYALPVLWHPRMIGLSHGVTWDDRPGSRAARLKKRLARIAFARSRAYVANDTFFLREMGLNAPPGQGAFQQVAPGRWFIPNCVDTEWFVPTPGQDELRALNAVLVPRNLYRNRGIHLAIAAFPRVLEAYPETHLVIVGGEGDPGYGEEVRRQVANSGVQHRVRFLGSVPWREMRAVYSAARVTVIPSICGEGTSLSALESMACGTPVVATAVGGLPDLPAWLAEPNPDALSEAILCVLARRDEVARAQQAEVRESYHLGRWAAAWRQVVKEVIE
ncbi:MAG TPA: glycosyltransferase family 4 protein, partial [Armatimonadota bacterium]|nr:glycosyltransferase family 4 protein [Armatimonadota bacterium]